MNRELEENLNNSYLVRRRLSNLKKWPGDPCYILDVGEFQIRMYTNADYSTPENKELSNLLSYKEVSVEVWENIDAGKAVSNNTHGSAFIKRGDIGYRQKIELYLDYRFSDFYNEIRYTKSDWDWKQGKKMPIPTLCDLIKHIDRINELTAFH